MLNEKRLGFIGSGNMAEAMIKGLTHSGTLAPERICSSDIRPDRLDALHTTYRIATHRDNVAVAKASDIIVLAVKPQILDRILEEISQEITRDKLVISIAAGVPVSAIESKLCSEARVIRAMPNTPALVQTGTTGVAPGEYANQEDLDLALDVFSSVGTTYILEETLLDAVTGLSGSGPAYIFLIIEALSDAGVKVGLSRHIAQAMAAQTVLGSAKLLIETGEHPGMLKDMVTSPGGTAIAGLHTLEEGGLRTTLINAVEVATRRSKALGEEMKSKIETK